MLFEYGVGDSKAQPTCNVVGPFRQPEVNTSLLESILGTVIASISTDHIKRLNGCARAIPTDHCARIERGCHAFFKWRIGNDLHGNGLIAAEDIHAILFRNE